jgi:GPN-loop GTPase
MLLATTRGQEGDRTNPRFHALNQAIVQLVRPDILSSVTFLISIQIEDHPLVSFLPLDLTSPDSLETVVSHIDYTMQYGEDEEPKEVRFFWPSTQAYH